MFDLKDLPPAIVEHQLLLVGLAVSWLVLGYLKGQSRKVRSLFLTYRWTLTRLSTGNPSAHAYPIDWVRRAAFLLPRSLELHVGFEENYKC
jgi:hypothetical protein